MVTSVPTRHLSANGALIERHWQELNNRRRLYTWLGLAILALTLFGSLWFANHSNAGKFFDRLPHFFDFVGHLMSATLFRLTLEECLAGVTREAARALGVLDETGTIEAGKSADLAIWNIDQPAELIYRVGFNPLCERIFKGERVSR